jgi:hypothetical protein
MSVFMLAALDVRHHLETYGAENLNARTLIILREKLSKDLRAGYALLLEQQRTKHSGQPALKLELAKAMNTLQQINQQLSASNFAESGTRAKADQDEPVGKPKSDHI